MSPPTHGDDDKFFADSPKGGTPAPQHEGPRTVVTSMSTRLPPKGWVAVGGGVTLVLCLAVGFAVSRMSGPKSGPSAQELQAAQAQVAKLEAEVKELSTKDAGGQKPHPSEVTAAGAGTAAAPAAGGAAVASPEQTRLVAELADTLGKKLSREMEKGDATLTRDANGLVLVLSEKLVFEADVDDISDSGESVLRHVGTVISRARGRDIEIRSFTDGKPIPSENEERYSSNWELSALRATQVVRFFQDESNIDPNHLVAMSFGQYHPAPEGLSKKRVRRIEVVIPAITNDKHALE